MKRLSKRLASICIALMMVTVLLAVPLVSLIGKAASCTFTVSGASVEVGDTFTVTLSCTEEGATLITYQGVIQYDSSYLEYLGDPKDLNVVEFDGFVSASFTFKALKAGTTTVTYTSQEALGETADNPVVEMTSTSNGGTVTITEPTTAPPETEPPTTEPPTTEPPTTEPPATEPPATEPPATEPPTTAAPPATEPPATEPPTTAGETLSDNNYLDDLSIYPGSFTPEFDPDEPYYYVTVGYDVTRLAVDAHAEDELADIIIVNRDLEVGRTSIDIKVTAANGDVRWYAIIVTRESEAGGTEPTDESTAGSTGDSNGDTTDGSTEGESSSEEETTVTDPLMVNLGGSVGYVQEELGSISRPEGFEDMTYDFRGVEIEVLKGIGKDLILVPVSDGAGVKLYIYDEIEETFYPYVGIQVTQALYTILPFDENETNPEGYRLTVIDFDGRLVDAWVRADAEDENYVLFYAMNHKGEVSLYRYDAGENTMQRVNKNELLPITPTTGGYTPESSSEDGTEVNGDYVDYLEETLDKVNRRDTIMFIIVVLLLVCMIAMYILFSAEKKGESDGNDPDDDPSDEDEETDPDDEDLDEGYLDDDDELIAFAALADAAEADEPDEDDLDLSEYDEPEEDDEPENEGYDEPESMTYNDTDAENEGDEITSLQKELAAIQLGMAGFVADMAEADEEEEEDEDEGEPVEPGAVTFAETDPEDDDLADFSLDDLNLDEPESDGEDLDFEDLDFDDLDIEDLDI